jgi:hypothetical protein
MNPTKLILHFSEFSTIFYVFYKFQQNGYTIEDALLRLGPWKDLGPRNWVPILTGRRARQNSGGSGSAPGRVKVRGRVHAHLGWVGGLGSGRGVTGVGARRWPAVAARGSGEEGAWLGNARPWEVQWVLGKRVGRLAGGGSERSGELTGGGGNGGRRLGWRAEGEVAAFK